MVVGPQLAMFAKVYTPENDFSRLVIPKEWADLNGEQLPAECKLQMTNTLYYKVIVRKTNEGWFFEDGWGNVVDYNCLTRNDILIFTYYGFREFKLVRFGVGGCIPPWDLAAPNYEDPIPYRHHDEGCEDSDTASSEEAATDISTISVFTSVLLASNIDKGLLGCSSVGARSDMEGENFKQRLSSSNQTWMEEICEGKPTWGRKCGEVRIASYG
ncbi:putative B3 domain-containing protein [Salvia divinorum]|uniref:B3 domain-containing protein n=1 Tax=Salvia divinorum TaxID=28513 RepID=A0ABD1I7T4_SALDI